MSGPLARMLADGRRLHLQHGPIDLVIEAWGAVDEVRAGYAQARACFADVLPTLCRELPRLRREVDRVPFAGPVAERMRRACLLVLSPPRSGGESRAQRATGWSGRGSCSRTTPSTSLRSADSPRLRGGDDRVFLTPMAAVAGAVADHVLAAMLTGRRLAKAYVNDGGDIAFHLAPGETLSCGLVADLAAPALDGRFALTHDLPARGLATSGRATKGGGGRSFSLGIADAATVLAADAASADAASTLVANAVDLPGHQAVLRRPAIELDPDSDLGERLVTVGLGALAPREIEAALARGAREAERLRRAGRILAAVLVLRGRCATVGLAGRRLAA